MKIVSVDRTDSFVTELNLAFINDEIIGTANIEYGDYYTSITDFWIKPEFRNQGNGDKFLKGIINQITKYHDDKIWLLVLKTNEPALKLYENNGFIFEYDYDEDNKYQWMSKQIKN